MDNEVETRKRRILIINPNSTEAMTTGLSKANGLGSERFDYQYFTAPSGPPSINDENDAAESLKHCAPVLSQEGYLGDYDAFLVACYSQHPLVGWIAQQPDVAKGGPTSPPKPVTGIFEASVDRSLHTIQNGQAFGIVSTGQVWEKLLSDAVDVYFARHQKGREQDIFAGVETTGLNATELHDAPAEEISKKLKAATKRLVKRVDVGAICLGCAGMAGMNAIVREAVVEELGEARGSSIAIVDGVSSGIAWLEMALQELY